MVVAEIATGYSALRNAYEIARGLKDINDRVALNAAVIDLQEKILSAQEAAANAKERLRELQETIVRFDKWDETAARYRLTDFGEGTFAYELREDAADGEPSHRLCPNCFESRKRSILQFQFKDASSRDFYKCPQCGGEYRFGTIIKRTPVIRRQSNRW